MAEELERNKQYQYAKTSNLVLSADRDGRRIREESGTGEAESLHGKLGSIKMGDRAFKSSSTSAPKKEQNVNKKRDRGAQGNQKASKKANRYGDGSDVLAVASDLYSSTYRPKTQETREAYEELLANIHAEMGDQPRDVIRSAAEETLTILKDDTKRDPDRQREITELLGTNISSKFTKFVNLGKLIYDFDVENDDKNQDPGENVDEDIAVVFDDDEDDEDEDDEDDEEDNDKNDNDRMDEDGDALHGLQAEVQNGGQSADKSKLGINDIDAYWLQRQVSKYYDDANAAIAQAKEILEALQIQDDRSCENKLVEMLGFDKFDFVKLLLSNKAVVQYGTRLKQSQNDEERSAIESEMEDDMEGGGAAILHELRSQKTGGDNRDIVGKFEQKTLKEVAAFQSLKPQADSSQKDAVGELTDDIIPIETLTARQDEHATMPRKMVNLEDLEFTEKSHLMANKECELPSTSWRAQKKGYEEVHVPAVKPVIPPSERLVPIKDLPSWAHPAFGSIKSLNRIQSKMVQTAFYEAHNVLLCAPTGAGKTNVALMCILNILGQYRNEDGSFNLNDFKIVYIAPMKALVQENVLSLGKKLKCFGITVNELSGDHNLTKKQIQNTQIIVTTPEKWDIVTRKSGDRTYTQLVKLMIIDEIHLLHDERGPVLESIVARSIRQVENTHQMMRLVGLSATLPNYEDVATFLRVNPDKGLFYFDSSYRPVPLQQQFIGITEKKPLKRFHLMNEICYEKVLQRAGKHQVLIFTHSRAETVKTARALRDMAMENDTLGNFVPETSASKEILREESESVKNSDLADLVKDGFAVHHAGLVGSDRSLVEALFADKHLQVLVSTATLAWGVNLPCHTVILKGTQMYSPEHGSWIELSPLDVMQMLGRAGRYGLDSEGEGIIMTQHSELQFYLSLMNQQLPIESQFIRKLPDMLNAEIVQGSVASVREAAIWLGYTYLYVRMLGNLKLYGISASDVQDDPYLMKRRLDLVHTAAMLLDKSNLIKYDRKSGLFQVTNLGRVASHYYISCASIKVFNENMKAHMSDIEIFRLFSLSGEFKNLHVREEEKLEMMKLLGKVPIPIKESVNEASAKVNALLQAYISRLKLTGFALIADMTYVQQSACRLMRALFEIALKRGWSNLSAKLLDLCKMVERRMWLSQSPLRQFQNIPDVLIRKLERNSDIPWDRYYDLRSQDLGEMVKIPKMGKILLKYVQMFPRMDLNASVLPITRSLLKINLTITPDFIFDATFHEGALQFHVIVEDGDGESILHNEALIIYPKGSTRGHDMTIFVPIQDPLPPQYFVKILCDKWLHSETMLPISFSKLILPKKFFPSTELLDLLPLPVSNISNVALANVLSQNFDYFNAIQSQTFNALYETDDSCLIAAPTGSGKTICALLAIARLFTMNPEAKAVYLCPKSELVKSTYAYLSSSLTNSLGVEVCMLSGNENDVKMVDAFSLIVASVEHWDNVSRKWKTKKAIQNISLYIADELHLVGGMEGPTYEIVLARAKYIASQVEKSCRMVGLSAPLANGKDVGEWIGGNHNSIFNFAPDVRPVPLNTSIHGFDANDPRSRLLSMSKHAYNAVSRCSPEKPSIVFVPSRRQAQLTAIDFISFAAAGGSPNRFVRYSDADVVDIIETIRDVALRQAVKGGVAYLHKDLSASDRKIVEELYETGAVTVIAAPFNYCWEIRSRSQCVVLLDTMYYDGREQRLVDYSMNEIMHMAGIASRPGVDNIARCVILCHSPKKAYIKKLLEGALPIESHLDHALHDHLCAEIVSKTIENKQDAVDYLTWTFFYRRLTQNPNYYNMEAVSHTNLSDHLSELIEQTIGDLEESKCVVVDDEVDLSPLNLGMISSHYYVNYTTIELYASSVTAKTKIRGIIEVLSASTEFMALAFRESESEMLERMAKHLPQALPAGIDFEDPSTKVLLLIQLHLSRYMLPIDLAGDVNTILGKVVKLIQAFVDVVSSERWLKPALAAMELSQMLVQGQWDSDPVLMQVPHFNEDIVGRLHALEPPVKGVFDILEMEDDVRESVLGMDQQQMSDIALFCNAYPNIDVEYVVDAEEVSPGDVVSVSVILRRDVDEDEEDIDALGEVVSHRYSHKKRECWWLVVGDKATNSLYSIKRVSFTAATKTKLKFNAPENPSNMTLYLISDSYIGCDQEYPFELKFAGASMETE